jgi:hypothetical protein
MDGFMAIKLKGFTILFLILRCLVIKNSITVCDFDYALKPFKQGICPENKEVLNRFENYLRGCKIVFGNITQFKSVYCVCSNRNEY